MENVNLKEEYLLKEGVIDFLQIKRPKRPFIVY